MTRGRNTGPDRATRELCAARDWNSCAWCGRPLQNTLRSLQHRKARGLGGTTDPAINRPSNLIWLCGSATTGCHYRAEQRTPEGQRLGFWLWSWQDPTQVPVRHAIHGLALLADDGTITPAERAA